MSYELREERLKLRDVSLEISPYDIVLIHHSIALLFRRLLSSLKPRRRRNGRDGQYDTIREE